MDRGWARWAAQAAELYTYREDWENRSKDGKFFYKLSEDSIATVRENLTQDYQNLADYHSEEIAQLLKDFGDSQDDTLYQLHDIGSKQQRAEEAKKSKAIILPNSDSTK